MKRWPKSEPAAPARATGNAEPPTVPKPAKGCGDPPTYTVIVSGASRRRSWGSYATIDQAAAVAQKLRQLGLPAVVEAPTP